MSRPPISTSALLVIDIQDSFKMGNTARWAQRGPDGAAFERNVTRLIHAYRQAQLPIFFVLHSDGDPGFERGGPHYKLMDFLPIEPHDPIIHKTTRNALTSTELLPQLLQRGVQRLIITGISMEQCCETTARVAADLGFDVDFVTEATLTFPIPNPETGEALQVAAIVERTEYALRNRFAQIVTVADLTAELETAASLPTAP